MRDTTSDFWVHNSKRLNVLRTANFFRQLLADLGEPELESEICHTLAECEEAAERIGFPIVVRPAYTLGGTGGGMAFSPKELRIIAENGLEASPITQVLIEKKPYRLERGRVRSDA